jgi:hypothetical protein
LLADPRAPTGLLTHRLIDLHLRAVWQRGRTRPRVRESIYDSLLQRWDGLGTPRCVRACFFHDHFLTVVIFRILHIVDLICDKSIYIALLLNYLVSPPRRPVIDDSYVYNYGWRGIILVIYAIASLLRPPSVRSLPHILVLLAFVASLPTVPMPADGAFDMLLLGGILFVISLLFIPIVPSPIFLAPPQQGIPLATLLWRGFTQIFTPLLIFFLPAIFISVNLLSLSLADNFLRLLTTISSPSSIQMALPAPIETRAGFLTLFFIVVILMVCALIMLVLVVPTTSLNRRDSKPWDRYGMGIGLEARRTFIKATIAYSSETLASTPSFPPPLNLVVLILVRLPVKIVGWATRRDLSGTRHMAERAIWRVSVVPVAALFAAVGFLVEAMKGGRRPHR